MAIWVVVSAIVFLLMIKRWYLVLFVAVGGVLFALTERQRLSLFRRCHDHRDLWMDAFRPNDRGRVDALLSTICDAFLIPRQYRFRLRPSDDIHGLYQRNVRGQLAESLEYAFLAQSLERDLGASADEALSARPCTVGSLVRMTAKPKRAPSAEEGLLNTEVAGRICELLECFSAVPAQQIGLSTRLREDLHISGDDVDDVLLELQEEFHTDWSGLDFHKYFTEEPHLLWPICFLYHGLVRGKWGNGTITVGHLIRVVQSGKWTDPDPTS
jgi:hypothetical protein